jgi:hypothetical protein
MDNIREIVNEIICNYYNNIIDEKVMEKINDGRYQLLSFEHISERIFKDDLLFYIYMHLEFQYRIEPPRNLMIPGVESSDFTEIMKAIEMMETVHLP